MNQEDEKKVKIKKEKQITLMGGMEFKNYVIPIYDYKYMTFPYMYT